MFALPKTQIATFHKIMNLSWCSSRATHLAVPTPSAQPKIIKEILWVLQGHQSTMLHQLITMLWLPCRLIMLDLEKDCCIYEQWLWNGLCWRKKTMTHLFGEKTSACVKSNTTFARSLQFSLNCPFWLNLSILWTCLDFSSFLEQLL